MKHLFVVHSSITEKVSRAIVDSLGLELGDVRVLEARNYEVSWPNVCAMQFPYTYLREVFPTRIHFLKSWFDLRKLDKYIDMLTGKDEFHAYLPHTRMRAFQLLISSHRCAGFSYIEEGMLDYHPMDEANRLLGDARPDIWDRCNYPGRLGKNRFFEAEYDQAFAVTGSAFPGFDRVHRFGERALKPKKAEHPGVPDSLDCIIVLDSVSTFGLTSREAVMSALGRVCSDIAGRDLKCIGFKLHPDQIDTPYEDELESYFRTAFSDRRVLRIADSVSLEELAFQRQDCEFYVNVSSVALYASYLGCKVRTYAPLIAQADAKYGEVLKRLPKTFFECAEAL